MTVVVLSSPKGGVGKSSLARNIAAAAARSGLSVVGVDLDVQHTLKTWADRRERAAIAVPGLPTVRVVGGSLDSWRSALAAALLDQPRLVIVDTPPSVELNVPALAELTSNADLVLVPVQPTQDDIDAAGPWMGRLIEMKVRSAFVLNRANKRTKSFDAMRTKLLKFGAVCPIEIPQSEEVHLTGGKGLGVLDLSRSSVGMSFEGLWSFVEREAGL